MGIWIESKNKERLEYCESIIIKKATTDDTGYFVLGGNVIIDKYETKEKALKVVAMIKKHIENINYFGEVRCGTEYEGTIATPNYEVFEMPQDEEVS